VDRKEVAWTLREVSTLLDLLGEAPFRSRAFASAARIVERLEEDLATLIREDRLTAIKGIGPGLAAAITELLDQGTLPQLEELAARVPGELIEMLSIRGLGPKKLHRLHAELGVTTLGELEYACQENRLLGLKGFGAKSQAKILEGLAALRARRGRFLLGTGRAVANEVADLLAALPGVSAVLAAGDVRRGCETIDRVDLVAATTDAPVAARALSAAADLTRDEDRIPGANAWQGRHAGGLPVDVRFCTAAQYGTTLWQQTGSPSHAAALTAISEAPVPAVAATEAAVYAAAGCAPIPPELREDRGEIAAARDGTLPALVEVADVRGLLHCHSRWSDGTDDLAALARAAADQGFEYLGISDHSQTAVYAHGLTAERLAAQRQELADLDLPLPVLQGVESDIRPDGALDYPDAVLAELDFVIASVHSHFGQPREEMTARIVRAVSHPLVDILGHPTGRLLLSREPYDVDLDAVLTAAAAHGVAVELNANPHRLDLDWRHIRQATELGIQIAINPDAHRIRDFQHVELGVQVARRGWLTRAQLLNALSADELRAWLAARRSR